MKSSKPETETKFVINVYVDSYANVSFNVSRRDVSLDEWKALCVQQCIDHATGYIEAELDLDNVPFEYVMTFDEFAMAKRVESIYINDPINFSGDVGYRVIAIINFGELDKRSINRLKLTHPKLFEPEIILLGW